METTEPKVTPNFLFNRIDLFLAPKKSAKNRGIDVGVGEVEEMICQFWTRGVFPPKTFFLVFFTETSSSSGGTNSEKVMAHISDSTEAKAAIRF